MRSAMAEQGWRVISTDPPPGLRKVGIRRAIDNAAGCRINLADHVPEAFWELLMSQIMRRKRRD